MKTYDDADAKMTIFSSRNKRIAVVLLKGLRWFEERDVSGDEVSETPSRR